MSKSTTINYVSHGGNHRVAIVLCPNICRRFLHLSKDAGENDSWVLRDYIGGRKIDHSKLQNAEDLGNIENEVLLSLGKDDVLDKNIEATDDWKSYLTELSERFINATNLGKSFSDFWEPLS